jgi:hypothetical protein
VSDNTILVYRAGAFAEIHEPSWRMNGRDFAHPSDVGWADAISAALDIEGNRLALRHGAIREASVIWWQLPDVARYAEFVCSYQAVAAVLIPHYPDWLGFYMAFVLPFLHGHASIELTHHHERIANVLIAKARHGEGDHVDRATGASEFDTRPRWALSQHQQRRACASRNQS